MGVLNLSNRGLHPLGQAETGLVVPLVGAREATFLGGMVVTAVTILIAWSIPGLPGLRLREAGEETLQAGQFEGQESGTEI